MKKLMLILAVATLPMVAFADTPAKKTTKKHKAHTTAASPATPASPATAARPGDQGQPRDQGQPVSRREVDPDPEVRCRQGHATRVPLRVCGPRPGQLVRDLTSASCA